MQSDCGDPARNSELELYRENSGINKIWRQRSMALRKAEQWATALQILPGGSTQDRLDLVNSLYPEDVLDVPAPWETCEELEKENEQEDGHDATNPAELVAGMTVADVPDASDASDAPDAPCVPDTVDDIPLTLTINQFVQALKPSESSVLWAAVALIGIFCMQRDSELYDFLDMFRYDYYNM